MTILILITEKNIISMISNHNTKNFAILIENVKNGVQSNNKINSYQTA